MLAKIKDANSIAAIYVGSSLTMHNPLIFLHNYLFMGCFCWSFSAKLMVGMLLNVVYGQDQEPKTHI